MSAFGFNERISLLFAEVQRQREDMHSYQETAVDFLIKNPFSALFVDLGLGKTISSLTVICHLLEIVLGEKILVIAPLKVATDVWPTEIGIWQHTAWLSHVVIRVDDDDPRLKEARQFARFLGQNQSAAETAERRRIMSELAHSSASIHIINREQVEWLTELHGPHWPYRVVFIDESSSFKDYKSGRFKALAKVRNTPGLITRLHLLTATPAAETYEHLFAQIFLLDRGKRLGTGITAFRDEYFVYNKYSMKYKLRSEAAGEQILAKIADVCLVMKRKDYLPCEEPTITRRMVKIAPAQLALIRKLERDFVMKLPDGTELEAKTAAILASMLLQMSSGCVYETTFIEDFDTDDLKKVKKVHQLHDHKIETLKEIVEEARTEGEPLLVSYFWQSSLAKLRKAFPKAVVMDKAAKCVKDWNAGRIPILLVHPQNAGHGLNLQYGGSILILYDLFYSLENYLQIIGRIDRQGQTKPVQVQLLVAEGTRDVLVADSLLEKEDAQEKLFVVLKRLIREYRKRQKAALVSSVEPADESI